MDKIQIFLLASILQSIAICFLCFCVISLRKMLCRFIDDEISASKKLHRYLTDPLDVVNSHSNFK